MVIQKEGLNIYIPNTLPTWYGPYRAFHKETGWIRRKNAPGEVTVELFRHASVRTPLLSPRGVASSDIGCGHVGLLHVDDRSDFDPGLSGPQQVPPGAVVHRVVTGASSTLLLLP